MWQVTTCILDPTLFPPPYAVYKSMISNLLNSMLGHIDLRDILQKIMEVGQLLL